MTVKGRVWKFGDDINTDEIIPARYLNMTDPARLAEHVMEDADPNFASKVSPGDIILAGKNFGCGSSREHAPVAIKGAKVSCVIAASFARIFFRNAFNMGLLIFESREAANGINDGDIVEVDPDQGVITNLSTGARFEAALIPPFMRQLVEDGGLIAHLKRSSAHEAI